MDVRPPYRVLSEKAAQARAQAAEARRAIARARGRIAESRRILARAATGFNMVATMVVEPAIEDLLVAVKRQRAAVQQQQIDGEARRTLARHDVDWRP